MPHLENLAHVDLCPYCSKVFFYLDIWSFQVGMVNLVASWID